jgi:prevent-host-death family protein
MKKWQLQVAKAKFSEMIREASVDGPQEITLHGEPVAVILSIALYNKMKVRKPSFVDFMLRSPLVGLDVDFERNTSHNREVDL